MTGKLEQACARQNIGHVIGHWQQAAVTIRAGHRWQGGQEGREHPIAIGWQGEHPDPEGVVGSSPLSVVVAPG
jgi:hypothetical protein